MKLRAWINVLRGKRNAFKKDYKRIMFERTPLQKKKIKSKKIILTEKSEAGKEALLNTESCPLFHFPIGLIVIDSRS